MFPLNDHYLAPPRPAQKALGALQIIQLVECPAPPPGRPHHPAPSYASSSYASSSTASSSRASSFDAYESSSEPPEDDDIGAALDEVADAESYCSSVPEESPADRTLDDTFRVRMRRVALWRSANAGFAHAPPSRPSSPSPTPAHAPPSSTASSRTQKRKAAEIAHDAGPRKHARSAPSAHSCPACDADFASPHGLRLHAYARASSSANDACRVAVEYGLEA